MQIVPKLYVRRHPGKKTKPWFCRIRYNGKPDAYEWFETEQEAQDHKYEIGKRCRANTFVEPSKQTLAEYFHWHNDGRKDLKRSSRDAYRTMFATHIEPVIGDVPLQKVTTAHLRHAFDRAADVLKDGSLTQMKAALSGTFEDACKETPPRLHVNPIKGLKVTHAAGLGEAASMRYKAIADEHYDRLLDAVVDHKYEDIIHFALMTFMRRGEIIGLHWRDVHLDEGYVEVTATLTQFSDYTTERTSPKNANARRPVILGPGAVALLRERRAAALAHALEHGVAAGLGEAKVFPVFPKAVTAWFQGLCKRHGIVTLSHKRASFHCLRHTGITHGVRDAETDKEIETISRRAGHASVAFTLQHYKSSNKADHQAVADRADNRVRRRGVLPVGKVTMLPIGRVQKGTNSPSSEK